MSSEISSDSQINLRSARNRPDAGAPRGANASLDIDTAFLRALEDASGSRLANNISRTTSRATLWSGETIRISHRRLAVGRGQGPAFFPSSPIAKRPRSVTLRGPTGPSTLGSDVPTT